MADKIIKSKDPADAKTLSRCVVKNDNWTKHEIEIYDDLCYTAATQNDGYFSTLVESEGTLVEAVRGQYKWGSGLTVSVTSHTDPEWLPGKNQMGKVHMRLRDRLLAEQKGEEWINTRVSSPTLDRPIEDLERSIDNKYGVFVKNLSTSKTNENARKDASKSGLEKNKTTDDIAQTEFSEGKVFDTIDEEDMEGKEEEEYFELGFEVKDGRGKKKRKGKKGRGDGKRDRGSSSGSGSEGHPSKKQVTSSPKNKNHT